MFISMNKLPIATRAQILSLLVEGSSLRSISRVCDVSINTVTKLLVDAGTVCAAYHDQYVVGVKSKRIQCSEIWSFCYAKEKNVSKATAAPEGAGDVWTWTAIDADSKLMLSWAVGDRTAECARAFMDDVAGRLVSRVQLTSDGHHVYLDAVLGAFDQVDFAQLVNYGAESGKGAEKKYSPSDCTGTIKKPVAGEPDPKHISTSYVERQNLNIRMGMLRFTRLTNAFSKKIDNHLHALALYFVFYNFVRMHKTLRVSPAMAAGVMDRLWDMVDIAKLIEDYEHRKKELTH
jgi:IS1 family transposase